jgi:hypothetical protein
MDGKTTSSRHSLGTGFPLPTLRGYEWIAGKSAIDDF